MEKKRRPFDDLLVFAALIICGGPVFTLCFVIIYSYILASAGIMAPSLDTINTMLLPPVLMIVGAAIRSAFPAAKVRNEEEDKSK
jgi:hypothetical protein